jgi:hypothetical protein
MARRRHVAVLRRGWLWPERSIDREVKAAPGGEVRVGIYTSMRADCTADPLPSILLAVALAMGPSLCAARRSKQLMSSNAWGRTSGFRRVLLTMTIASNSK